jgi:hypothetical protein
MDLVSLRWPEKVFCPFCGSWPPKSSTMVRRKASGVPDVWEGWRCAWSECERRFSLTSGTYLANTTIDLMVWVEFAELVSSMAMTAKSLAVFLPVTEPTCRLMIKRLYEAYDGPFVSSRRKPARVKSPEVGSPEEVMRKLLQLRPL